MLVIISLSLLVFMAAALGYSVSDHTYMWLLQSSITVSKSCTCLFRIHARNCAHALSYIIVLCMASYIVLVHAYYIVLAACACLCMLVHACACLCMLVHAYYIVLVHACACLCMLITSCLCMLITSSLLIVMFLLKIGHSYYSAPLR